MEEKKIEGYTPEEVEAIRKKDRFFTKARNVCAVSMLSLLITACVTTVGTTVPYFIEESYTDKQEALVEELTSSSPEYIEYHTNTVNNLRADLISNKITDQKYIDSINNLNSIEHKRDVLLTLKDVNLTEYNNLNRTVDAACIIKKVVGFTALSSVALGFGAMLTGNVLVSKDKKHYAKYKEIINEPID